MNSTDIQITRYVDGVRLTMRRHSYIGYLADGSYPSPVVIYKMADGHSWATGHGDGQPIGADFISVKEAIRETERLTGMSFRRP